MTKRCGWVGAEDIYRDYHDYEWGVPEYDSRALWEKLILDGFQAGLSWITILKKREGFRQAFEGFDPNVIAMWGAEDVARLVQDTRIIRHRGKIEATIGNARAWQAIEAEEGFAKWVWSYVGGAPIQSRFATAADVPTSTEISLKLSKDLKKRGFKFCGPTIVYAFMEAVGMVNDHVLTCSAHDRTAAMAIDAPDWSKI